MGMRPGSRPNVQTKAEATKVLEVVVGVVVHGVAVVPLAVAARPSAEEAKASDYTRGFLRDLSLRAVINGWTPYQLIPQTLHHRW